MRLMGFLLGLVVFVFAMPVIAEDEVQQSVAERLEAFTQDFSALERNHFSAIYNSYNLLSVVKTVQKDVGNAIKKCGEENPDMKSALNIRHTEWRGALKPVLDEAQGNLDNMVAVQDYAAKKDVRAFFKFLDDRRAEKLKDIEKIPVTTPEACESLRVKMDDTQENLTQLLRTTLVSVPQEVQENVRTMAEEEAAKREAEAAEQAEEE